jgi:hypothetical protein
MVTKIPHINTSASMQVIQMREVAETIRDDALESANSKLGAFQRGRDLKDLLKQSYFFDGFMYGLAIGIAEAISANDERVFAIYICEPSGNPDFEAGVDMPLDASVHQLLLVSKPSAALEAFITSLDRAMVASLKDLPSPLFARREWILDAKLLSEEDVVRGTGYAILLSSTFAPALKIWQRETEA